MKSKQDCCLTRFGNRLLLLCCCFLLLSSLNAHAEAMHYYWAKGMSGAQNSYGRGIALDNIGNVYTVGYFQGTVDFAPGPVVSNHVSGGGHDVFVSKLDTSGNHVWTKTISSTDDVFAYNIDVDSYGNVYIIGDFYDTVDCDSSAATYYLNSTGSADAFIAKFDSNGDLVWAKQFGGISPVIGKNIFIDPSGNVYSTGYFQGTADFDPSPTATTYLASSGDYDIFISKLDSAGNFVWAKRFGGSDRDQAYGIEVGSSGHIYTTGNFKYTVDFDPGPGTHNLISSGDSDIFICKLDNNGNYVWAKSVGGSSEDNAYAISTDYSENVIIAGYFEGQSDFDPGPSTLHLTSAGLTDAFTCKLDNGGNFIWANHVGGIGNDYFLDVDVDQSGNIYTTGGFEDTVDFDSGTGEQILTSGGSSLNSVISKLDSTGHYVWAGSISGEKSNMAYSIAVDQKKTSHFTGHFAGIADFNSGAPIDNLTSAGGNDHFIVKIMPYEKLNWPMFLPAVIQGN